MSRIKACVLAASLVLVAIVGLRAHAEETASVSQKPIPVEIKKTDEGWQLFRGGQPYFVMGAGGDASKELLAKCGANSFRTWGADKLEQELNEAAKLGLTVTAGIWLGHKEHGFDYNNANQVAAQSEMVRQTILRFKDHPALLMWALGNEMEGKGDDAAVWSAINNLASMAKRLDPNHPTMTVVAEIGGDKTKHIHRLCPDIDIVGINSYGGITSIPKRYREAGGTKPYIVTEFAQAGVWEIHLNSWGGAPELSSTQKGEVYKHAYLEGILSEKGKLCLGSYAFTWGNKQEASATWFGMLLSDGSRLAPVDALTELWSGKPQENLCPRIDSLTLSGPDDLNPGDVVKATLQATDPENDPVTVTWGLSNDAEKYNIGGATEKATLGHPEAILKSDNSSVEVKMPEYGGRYRLYVCVRDNHGGAAVANIPLHVKGAEQIIPSPNAKLPLIVYSGSSDSPANYIPSGWMGNTKALNMDEKCKIQPHAGAYCVKVEYQQPDNWAGVAWQNPASDWGDQPGGFNLKGATKLTFWARGEEGAEKVKFGLGGIGNDKKYFDTAKASTEVVLTTAWTQYTIDLSGKDLTRVKSGFTFSLAGAGKKVTFYLDGIQYE